MIISRADHKIYYKCLPTKFSAVFFAVVVGLTWAQSIEAYDSRYIYAKGNGALVLQDNLFRKPTLDGYELNAVKKFGALLLKLKISAIAKIRLYLNSDGKVQKIVFLEGSPTAAQLSDLSRLIGQKPFGAMTDDDKSGGPSDLIIDFTVAELKGVPTRKSLLIGGGVDELLALKRTEIGKIAVPPRPSVPAYGPSARAYDDEIAKIYSKLPGLAPTSGDDDKIVAEIIELCSSLESLKSSETDELIEKLEGKIQACPVYGDKSSEQSTLKPALRELGDFSRQVMQEDLSENRSNLARILKLQKMLFELTVKANGDSPVALIRLCEFLESADMAMEASVLYKNELDYRKKIDTRRNALLPQLQHFYSEALTMAGKPQEAAVALAALKGMKDADLVDARKKNEGIMEKLLTSSKPDTLAIIAKRLELYASWRREGNVQAAREELSRAVKDTESFSSQASIMPLQLEAQLGNVANMRLSNDEQSQICKIAANLEANMRDGFSSFNYDFSPEDESGSKESVVKVIIKEKEKKFGPRSAQLTRWLRMLADHLEKKHKYQDAEAIRKSLLEISENQSGTNVPASVRLAIVQLKLGKVDEAKRNYQQAVSSLQKRMDDPRSAGPAHSSLMQLVRAFIDAKDLSDADECWRSAFTLKMDWGLNQTYLNDLLDAYLARKKYDQGIDLLNFVIEIATPEPGQEANSVSARRQLAGLTLVASTDAFLGTRRGEMKTLSEKEFTELVRLCDTKDKPSLQFWKMQKDHAVQERIDELRQLGLENDAQKLERKFVTR